MIVLSRLFYPALFWYLLCCFQYPFQLVDPIVLCVPFLLTYWWLTSCSYFPTQLIMTCFRDNRSQVQR